MKTKLHKIPKYVARGPLEAQSFKQGHLVRTAIPNDTIIGRL